MLKTNFDVGIGVDLGSSSVRVGIFIIENDQMITHHQEPVPYFFNDDPTLWEYTQSTDDIMEAIEKCLKKIEIDKYKVVSCGVSATCSMAVFTKYGQSLEPYNGDKEDCKQNVVFWMDSYSKDECRELNQTCKQSLRDYMGGNFINEMGIPKLKRVMHHFQRTNKEKDKLLVCMDLHRYIAYELATSFNWSYEKLINSPNSNGIGHDGELSGWSSSFYRDILEISPNVIIGPQKKIFTDTNQIKVNSCIDCYSSWFTLCSANPEKSLFIVAGTSTCYLYASKLKKDTIPGVWGPFTDILDNSDKYSIYEGGQSCTGKLIECLFKTHPASSDVSPQDWPKLIHRIEENVAKIEHISKNSIHLKTKHMFYYGDLQGNRTPYADSAMSGMFIGESTDFSFTNLTYKYICILEFLAFQIKLMIQIFNQSNDENSINDLRMCGSQAKNKRLLSLIAMINNYITIQIPTTDVSLSGVHGSYLLGKAALLNEPLIELIHSKSQGGAVETFQPERSSNKQLIQLLNVKYEIHLDMAKQQMKYRDAVNKVIDNYDSPFLQNNND